MLEQLGYVYDKAWNLNFRTNNALIQAFNVNNLNELTTTTNTGTLTVAGTTTVPATSVTVNGASANRYADATFALGGFTVTNGINTYTAVGEDSSGDFSTNTVVVNLPATNNYTYDLNGNLLSDGTRNFAYDDENELIGVCVSNTWSNSFAYDGKMRMRIERDFTWQTGAWIETNEIHLIYDGNVVIEERNADNNPLVTYTRGSDLSGMLQGAGGIGGLLARTHDAEEVPGSTLTNAFYHADGNGNVTCLMFQNQQIAAKYLYDPYGNILAMSGPLAGDNKYRFSSKQWVDNANLYYYGYRFYDPNLQRWLNRDPVGEPGGLNLYEFVGDAEPNYFDFLGDDIGGYGGGTGDQNGPPSSVPAPCGYRRLGGVLVPIACPPKQPPQPPSSCPKNPCNNQGFNNALENIETELEIALPGGGAVTGGRILSGCGQAGLILGQILSALGNCAGSADDDCSQLRQAYADVSSAFTDNCSGCPP